MTDCTPDIGFARYTYRYHRLTRKQNKTMYLNFECCRTECIAYGISRAG